jgi:hypothetical protein
VTAIGCQWAGGHETLRKRLSVEQDVSAHLDCPQEREVGFGEAQRSAHRDWLIAGGLDDLSNGLDLPVESIEVCRAIASTDEQ